MHRLNIFISSTSDLQNERNAVEEVLKTLEIDGSRYESWPSTPNPPIEECLKQVEESEAIVLILGSSYGNPTQYGISATHLEFRKAKELRMPVFAFILETNVRELEQVKFIKEVQENEFHGKPIKNIADLKKQVKCSISQELTRCFREIYSPPVSPTYKLPVIQAKEETILPQDQVGAKLVVQKLYEDGYDAIIHELASIIETKFRENIDILNYMYMAEVNLGMDGNEANEYRLRRAIDFWESKDAKRVVAAFCLNYNIGNAYTALKEHEKAIRKYKECLIEKSDYAECWKNLGNAYIALSDILSARNCLNKSLQYNPQLFEALYSMGTLSITRENDLELALAFFNRIVISALPVGKYSSVQGWKAYIYLKLGRYDEGITNIEDAIKKSPDTKWAWDIGGRLYALIRREDKTWLHPSLNFWNRFISKDPGNKDAWAELGYIYWFLQVDKDQECISDKALKAFKRALELDYEDDGLIYDRVGHLFQGRKDWIGAKPYFEQAATLNPDKFGYCFGVCLLSLEQYQDALPWLIEAAEKHHPDALSWSQVAICYEKLGNLSNAENAFKKAIELEPNNPKHLYDLGGLYWNYKVLELAKVTWTEAMKKYPDYELSDKVVELLRLMG